MGRIYKRGEVYWYQAHDRRVSLRTSDRKAAELRVRQLERLTADPTYATAHATTFGTALQRFLAQQTQRERAEGTLTMYGFHVGHLARVVGEHTPLAEISSREVDGYMAKRRQEGASPSTIAKELGTLRGALRLALRRGEYHRPLEQVMPDRYSPEYQPLDRHLTEPQIAALLAVLEPERAAVVAFLVATAADWRCVADARPEDFTKTFVLVRGTKNARRWRQVPVLAPFKRLAELAARHVPFAPWGNVRRDLEVACRRAGVPRVTPRDLRRSHSKLLRARGIEPSLIGAMLGHADSRMVERVYGRLPADALGRLIGANVGRGAISVPSAKARTTKRRSA